MLEEIEMPEDGEEQEEITHARSWDALREKSAEIPLCGTKHYDSLLGFADDERGDLPGVLGDPLGRARRWMGAAGRVCMIEENVYA